MSLKLEGDLPRFPILKPALQIGFYKRLQNAEAEFLMPALLQHVSALDIQRLDQELHSLVEAERLGYLAQFGLRGELLFPVPYILIGKPKLLAYYRLLFGFSQKEFYNGRTFGLFSSMESQGRLTARQSSLLQPLCKSLIESGWLLASNIPIISREILEALSLITFGGQLRGSYNTLLGRTATTTVFDLIKDIVRPAIQLEDATAISIKNAAGRTVRIEFAPDPDIAIRELMGSGKNINRIAIEIKGGKDFSNIHNRLGEAEKSHQKARQQGYTQFWTMVNVSFFDERIAHRESPTTTAFFSIAKIIDPSTQEHRDFRERLLSELGL